MCLNGRQSKPSLSYMPFPTFGAGWHVQNPIEKFLLMNIFTHPEKDVTATLNLQKNSAVWFDGTSKREALYVCKCHLCNIKYTHS